MKKIISLIIPILFSFIFEANAQLDKTYNLTGSFSVVQCDAMGNQDKDANNAPITRILPSNIRVKVIREVNSTYIIEVLRKGSNSDFSTLKVALKRRLTLSNNENNTFNTNYKLNTQGDELYFLVDKSVFLNNAQKLKSVLSFGAATIPLKVRFATPKDANGIRSQYLDFGSDINLGLNACFTIRPNSNSNFHHSLFFGLSYTSVQADSSVTKGFLRTNTKLSALTPRVGYYFSYNDMQFVINTGWDFLAGPLGDNWKYQSKIWLGFGLGYNIFSTSSSTSTQP